jgi:phospholipase C
MRAAPFAVFALLASATAASASVSVTSPSNGATVTSPVQYVATATASTCAKGVASMGIYVNSKLVYSVSGASINTEVAMNTGAEDTVVEEWDYCGSATTTPIDVTVVQPEPPTVTMTANSPTILDGGSTLLTVMASDATSVVVSGPTGTTNMADTGGNLRVYPTATGTYTVQATNSNGTSSASVAITVLPASSLSAIQHVVFMLQENHTFDNYFGMLNPYRQANGWDVGADGKTYNVDGIDDKLDTISNEDDEGASYPLFKFTTTCIDDETSSWLESYGQVSPWSFLTSRPIDMDGFVHTAEDYAKNCASSGTCSGNFTDTTGARSMGYYDEGFLNYYYYMASQFALDDRWFSPVSSKSIDNRIATFTGGTTQGLVFDPGNDDHLGQLDINNIFEELDKASVSWKIYYTVTDGECLDDDECSTSASAVYPSTDFSSLAYSYQYLYENPSKAACVAPTQASSVVGDTTNSFCIDPNHIAPLSQYYTDLTNNTLPSFAFIEAGYGNNDEHPGSGQSILAGQAEVANIVNSLMDSTSWGSSVFFFAYDEGGGPYDHVPPVPGHSNQNTDASLGTIPQVSQIAVNPDSYKPCLPSGGTPTLHCDLGTSDPGANSGDAAAVYGFAAQLGFRVPNMIVSPFTRAHYVSHTPMDHTAVIKFVEDRFIGPSAYLTTRDAAQSDLLEFFDFSSPPWATPPTPPVPVSESSLGYNPCTPTSMGNN